MARSMNTAVMAWLNMKVEKMNFEMQKAVIETGEDIAKMTVHFIETRGTAKSGKQGRIETGAMRDSVGFSVSDISHDSIEVRAGYNDAPFYTVFQELGTRRIEAMEALIDASEANLPILKVRLHNVMKGM